MEKDYVRFANNVAAIYFDKLPEEVTVAERDEAYSKYMKKVPSLLEKVETNGIKAPEDMDKYILLSDVNSIYSGSEYNPETGGWDPILNDQGVQVGCVNMDAAYDYYQKKTGKTAEQMLKREKDSLSSFQRAANQRPNVVELTQEYQKGDGPQMTQETAQRLINETPEELITAIKDKGDSANEIEKMTLRKYQEAFKFLFKMEV
jgi:hypothetical protein